MPNNNGVSTSGKTITADELRWLAEHADGKRDEDLALYVDKDGALQIGDPKRVAEDGGKPLFPVRTPLEGAGGLRGGAEVFIKYKGKEHSLDGVDAVFMSQSAVEKFLLPYYARMQSGAKIQALYNKLLQKGVVAALHTPPSITNGFPPKTLQTLMEDCTFTTCDVTENS